MNIPGTHNVRIRLEIDVPTCSVDAVAPEVRFQREERIQSNFVTLPTDGQWACVHPDGTGTGTFDFKVTYNSPYPNEVGAIAYRADLYPGFGPTSTMPAGGQKGQRMGSTGIWVWAIANMTGVPGASHNATGVPNTVAVFRKSSMGTLLYFDDSIALKGITEGLGSCAGSGSIAMMKAMEELDAADSLLIAVRGGPFHGPHHAKRREARKWVADTGKGPLEIVADSHGRLVLRVGSRRTENTRIDAYPFTAVFPGAAFDTNDDIVVTAR